MQLHVKLLQIRDMVSAVPSDRCRYASNVLWLQASVSFVLWIAGGTVLARKPVAWMANLGRGQRVLLATSCLFGSVLALMLGFGLGYGVGGLLPDRMTPVAWLGVTLGGVGFVVCQVLAAKLLLEVLRDDRSQKG